MRTLNERFWDRVDKTDGCWVWTGAQAKGYGRFYIGQRDGKNQYVSAYRFAYELLVGPIPEGLYVDHLCRNPICVRPAHLELVTNRENVLRGNGAPARNARKTHCTVGHPLTTENVWVDKNGWRHCRECGRRRWRESEMKRRAVRERAS